MSRGITVDAPLKESEDEQMIETSQQEKPRVQGPVSMNLNWSTMNQLKYLANLEGMTLEELAIELLGEGLARRLDESRRGAPSHLMTRTGYLHSNDTGYQAPTLSHHQTQQRQPQQPRSSYSQNNRQKNDEQYRGKKTR